MKKGEITCLAEKPRTPQVAELSRHSVNIEADRIRRKKICTITGYGWSRRQMPDLKDNNTAMV